MGGGRGGGPHRGVHVPFAGMIGLGSTSELLTGGLSLAAAGIVGEELAFLPQSIGGAEAAALGNAQPWINLRLGSLAFGRAAGFSGENLLGLLGGGNPRPPNWMARLGLGPTQALSILQNFGIAPQSETQGKGIIQSVAGMQFQGALSGLPLPMLESSAAQMARYGLIAPTREGIGGYATQLQHVMSRAVQEGMDRAAVLKSIDAGVAMAAQSGGLGVSMGRTASFLSSFAMLPGGRTGEIGLRFGAHVQQALGQVTHAPIQTIAFASVLQGLNTPGKLRTYFDRIEPGFYESVMSNPVGRQQLSEYFTAVQSGDTFSASRLMSDLLRSSGASGAAISTAMFTNNPVVNAFPAGTPQGVVTRAGVLGVSTVQLNAYQLQQTQRQNARIVESAARMHGMDPRLAVAMAMQESSLGLNMGPSSAGALGLMQIMPATGRAYGATRADLMNPAKNAMVGTAYFQHLLHEFGGSMEMALMAYNLGDSPFHAAEIRAGRPGAPGGATAAFNRARTYAEQVLNRYYALEGPDAAHEANMPHGLLASTAAAQAGMMMGSRTSAAEMNVLVYRINAGLDQVIQGARTFAATIEHAQRTMSQGGVPNGLLTSGSLP